jgi:hypothetical protein
MLLWDRLIFLFFSVFYLFFTVFRFGISYLVTLLVSVASFILVLRIYKKWVSWTGSLEDMSKLKWFCILRFVLHLGLLLMKIYIIINMFVLGGTKTQTLEDSYKQTSISLFSIPIAFISYFLVSLLISDVKLALSIRRSIKRKRERASGRKNDSSSSEEGNPYKEKASLSSEENQAKKTSKKGITLKDQNEEPVINIFDLENSREREDGDEEDRTEKVANPG